MKRKDFQTILKVGAECGTISLLGCKQEDRWSFLVTTNESALFDLVSEEDAESFGSLVSRTKIVSDWGKALKLLDKYPWASLSPKYVNREFRNAIWKALLEREPHEERLDWWIEHCFPDEQDYKVAFLSQWMRTSKHVVVFTGAGMSTESGIPDFRSKSGFYSQYDPAEVATVDALKNNPQQFHEFYSRRITDLQSCKPNRGHEILAKWQQKGLVRRIVTQNVDAFHQIAGSEDVCELHGSLRSARCVACEAPGTVEHFVERVPCTNCGSQLRPNVVLFDEHLPEKSWERAVEAMEQADLVLIIGTSLEVCPANRLPSISKGKVVLINLENRNQRKFHLVIQGKAREILSQLDELL